VAVARVKAVPLALVVVALALPVRSTAAWLGGAHGVTPEQIQHGLWILKVMLIVMAASAALTVRLAERWSPVPGTAPATPPTSSPAASSRETWLFAALLAVALVLRLIHLEAGLWLDEIDTLARYVTLPLPQILSTYDTQNHHPLYSLVARIAWLATSQDWSIRLPAVAFGVASLWATWRFALRVTSRAEALLAVFVLTVSYHHVWFSQNGRGYTAMLFFAIVGTAAFLRLADEREAHPGRLVWLYAAAMALATYTHLTAALVAVGHAVALATGVAWRPRDALWKAVRWPVVALGLSALLTVTLYALVLPQVPGVLFKSTGAVETVEWTSSRWLVTETIRVLGSGVPGGVVTVLGGLFVLATGVVSYWRQSPRIVLVTLWPVAATAGTMVALGHHLWPRFFFFAAAFLVLFALRGGFVLVGWALRGRGQAVAVAGAVAVALLSTVMLPRAWRPKQQYGAAAAWVETQRVTGDAVVAVDVAAYVYSLRGAPPAWRLTANLDTLRAIEASSRRTWVVQTFPTRLRQAHPDIVAHLAAEYREARVFAATVGGGELRVLLNDARAAHE
jgi:4-amino-4-deoxy-L-arabinose transferase-like glycosyltransferase